MINKKIKITIATLIILLFAFVQAAQINTVIKAESPALSISVTDAGGNSATDASALSVNQQIALTIKITPQAGPVNIAGVMGELRYNANFFEYVGDSGVNSGFTSLNKSESGKYVIQMYVPGGGDIAVAGQLQLVTVTLRVKAIPSASMQIEYIDDGIYDMYFDLHTSEIRLLTLFQTRNWDTACTICLWIVWSLQLIL
jgi:hypothetical protein